MGKIFPHMNYCLALIPTYEMVERDRHSALTAAAQGEFQLSLRIFRRSCHLMPSIPFGCKSHVQVLQELRLRMEACLSETTSATMNMLYADIKCLIAFDQSDERDQAIMEILKEHALDIEYFSQSGAMLSYLAMYTDQMLHEGKILDAYLICLEQIFSKKTYEAS